MAKGRENYFLNCNKQISAKEKFALWGKIHIYSTKNYWQNPFQQTHVHNII